MNETEFLKSWPTLAPAVWRLVKAAVKSDRDVREQIGAVTQGPSEAPEVTPAARDAATSEIENHGVRLRSGGCGGQDYGIPVQRAMDAAVAESQRQARAELQGIIARRDAWIERCDEAKAEVARLTKELTEERDLRRHAEKQAASGNGLYTDIIRRVAIYFPEGERGLDWDVLPDFLGGAISDLKQQLASAQSTLKEHGDAASWIITDPTFQQLSPLAKRFIQSLRSDGENIFSELRSALAESEQNMVNACGLLATTQSALNEKEDQYQQACNDWQTQVNEMRGRLSTERAAREKAEAELRAIDQALFDMSLHYAPNRALAIETRAKVQREVTAERDALRAQLQQAEADVIMWKDNHSLVSSKLQQAESDKREHDRLLSALLGREVHPGLIIDGWATADEVSINIHQAGDFPNARIALEKFISELQRQYAEQEKCPFFSPDSRTTELQTKLRQAEQERDEAREDLLEPRHIEADVKYYITYGGARFDVTGPEIVQMHMAWLAAPQLMQDISSLRAELSATQQTALRVEQELDRGKGLLEVYDRTDVLCTQGALIAEHKKALAERDALQKRNAELQTTVSTLAGHIKSGQQRASDSARNFRQAEVKRREAEARNAELVKALEKIINASDGRYILGIATEALNQSPE